MKLGTILVTEAEARRFLKKVEALKAAMKENATEYSDSNPRESGAVRRASMDLTRALAELRRS